MNLLPGLATLKSQNGLTSSRPPPSRKCLPTTATGSTSGALPPPATCTAVARPESSPSPRCTVDAKGGVPSPPTSAGLPSPSPAKSSRPSRR